MRWRMNSSALRSLVASSVLSCFLLASACGGPQVEELAPADPALEGDAGLDGTSPAAVAILGLLNDAGTGLDHLVETVGLDGHAAENLIDRRDGPDGIAGTGDDQFFGSLEEVDAVPNVGPIAVEALRLYVSAQGWVSYQPGEWEGVAFSAGQVVLALDVVANADLETLDDAIALDVRAAQHIIDARPIVSMDDLAGVKWVGPSALEKIRSHLPTWQEEQGSVLEVYDGVTYTHLEAARALAAANDANRDALSSVEIYDAQATIVIEGRYWESLAQVADTWGIGPLTMQRLRTLGQSYADVDPYLVTPQDAAGFAEQAKSAVSSDAAWKSDLVDLLLDGDFSQDEAWALQTASEVAAAIGVRLDAFTASEVGRDYSSASAALQAVLDHTAGLQSAALTGYPDGVLAFIPDTTSGERLTRAKKGLLHYWQHTFVGSPEWQATFGPQTWNDVKGTVSFDIANLEDHPYFEAYEQPDQTIFVSSVYGLYTEANVDRVGKVTRVYVEID